MRDRKAFLRAAAHTALLVAVIASAPLLLNNVLRFGDWADVPAPTMHEYTLDWSGEAGRAGRSGESADGAGSQAGSTGGYYGGPGSTGGYYGAPGSTGGYYGTPGSTGGYYGTPGSTGGGPRAPSAALIQYEGSSAGAASTPDGGVTDTRLGGGEGSPAGGPPALPPRSGTP